MPDLSAVVEDAADEIPVPRSAPEPAVLRTGDNLAALDTADLRRSISPVSERWIGQLVYSKLLRREDVGEDRLEPDLALALPEAPDPTTLIYTLRPGVRWDSRPPGRDRSLDADDVRLTIESQQDRGDPTFARGGRLGGLTVETLDAARLVIRSEQPDVRLATLPADRWMAVLPAELLDQDLTAPEEQRGSGPFRLEAADESGWSLVANPDYHFGAPAIRAIDLAARTGSEQAQAFAAGEQNALERAAVAVARSVARTDDAVSVAGLAAVMHLFFRIERPPWDDVRRRRALHLALDRSALAAAWFGEGAGPSGYIAPPHSAWALPPSELASLPGYRNDPDDRAAARSLWEAAGGSEAVEPLTLSVRAADERDFAPAAAVAAQLRETLGVTIQVTPQEDAEIVAALVDGRVPWLIDFAPASPDALDAVIPLVHSRGELNGFAFANAEVDEAIAEILGTFDRAARRLRVEALQRTLLDLLPTVPLVHPALATGLRPGIVGRRPDVLDNSWQWADVRIE